MYTHPLERVSSYEDLLEIPTFIRKEKDLEEKYAHPDDADWEFERVVHPPVPSIYR